MIRLNWISSSTRTLKAIIIVSGAFVSIFGFLLRFDAKDYETNLFKDILTANSDWAWITIPIFTAIGGVAAYFKTHFGTANIWEGITTLLEEYKRTLFEARPECANDPAHFQRVTLYKFTSWRWAFCWKPWTGWMVPVARTGHTTHRHKIPRFRAPRGYPDKAEGIAGTTFVNNVVVPVSDLPELSNTSSDTDIEDYAKRGLVSAIWVKKRESCNSRSLLGIPIEVKGRPWGAIVIDSRHPEAIGSAETITNSEFSAFGKLLSKLLEN